MDIKIIEVRDLSLSILYYLIFIDINEIWQIYFYSRSNFFIIIIIIIIFSFCNNI